MRKRRNKRISIISAALLFAVVFFASSLCFADDFLIKSIRDETLFMSVPATWQVEETGDLDEDSDRVDSGEYAFKILELKDAVGAKQGEMWIYAEPLNNGFYYCDTKEDTEEYFDDCGYYAVDSIIETAFPNASSWDMETEYIKGEDDFTYAVRSKASVDGKPYMIYLACDFVSSGGVHEVLIFEGHGDLDTRDRIAESIEGYGYAIELIENRDYTLSGGDNGGVFRDDDTEIDMENLIGAFFWIVIWAAVIVFAVKMIRSARKPDTVKSVRSSFGQRQPVRDRSARKSIDKWVFKESKPINREHAEHGDCQVQGGSKYTGYRESLKTLHKSGLLTTKEMNELLEKHKDDI